MPANVGHRQHCLGASELVSPLMTWPARGAIPQRERRSSATAHPTLRRSGGYRATWSVQGGHIGTIAVLIKTLQKFFPLTHFHTTSGEQVIIEIWHLILFLDRKPRLCVFTHRVGTLPDSRDGNVPLLHPSLSPVESCTLPEAEDHFLLQPPTTPPADSSSLLLWREVGQGDSHRGDELLSMGKCSGVCKEDFDLFHHRPTTAIVCSLLSLPVVSVADVKKKCRHA